MEMGFNRRGQRALLAFRLLALLGALILALTSVSCASQAERGSGTSAEAPHHDSSRLEPRYQPREPEGPSWYDTKYLFAMSRGVADSTIHPAAQVPLMIVTVPLDIAFLPFAAIAGFF